jgi:hypothetical protein
MNKEREELKEVMLDVLLVFFEELQGEEWKLDPEQKEIYNKAREILIIKNKI